MTRRRSVGARAINVPRQVRSAFRRNLRSADEAVHGPEVLVRLPQRHLSPSFRPDRVTLALGCELGVSGEANLEKIVQTPFQLGRATTLVAGVKAVDLPSDYRIFRLRRITLT